MFLEARAPSSVPGQKKVPKKSLVSDKMGMKIGDLYGDLREIVWELRWFIRFQEV